MNKNIRICILTRSTVFHQKRGGMETHTQVLGEGLVGTGARVEVLTTRHPEGKSWEKLNRVNYHFISEGPPGEYSSAWWKGSLSKFNDLNKIYKFDAILGESEGAAGLISFRNKYNVPIIQIAHGSLRGELETLLRNIDTVKDGTYFLFKALPYAIKTYFFLDLRSIRRVDAVIGVSKELTESLRKDYFLNPRKLFTVLNGVDIEKFKVESEKLKVEFRKNLGISDKEKVLLFLGRLEREKGVHLLLETLPKMIEEFPNIKCLIVGGGPLYENLVERTKILGIKSKAIFTGQVAYDETPKYYNIGDIFVLPTLRVEGFPMTLAEAAACGLPVVASKIGGVPSAVENGKTGFLVNPKEKKALKKTIIKLLGDDNLRKTMSDNAQRKAWENFSQEKMTKETLKVINHVLTQTISGWPHHHRKSQ